MATTSILHLPSKIQRENHEGIYQCRYRRDHQRLSLDETDLDKAVSAAACEGALESGASGILIEDAPGRARNIIASKLPHEVRLIRGWAHHPLMMMQGLVETFQWPRSSVTARVPGQTPVRWR